MFLMVLSVRWGLSLSHPKLSVYIQEIFKTVHPICSERARYHSDLPENIHDGEGTLLMSLNGSKQQEKHHDCDQDHPNSVKSILALAFLSPNGKFVYYVDGVETMLHFNAGDIIMFSGTLEHSGKNIKRRLCKYHHV